MFLWHLKFLTIRFMSKFTGTGTVMAGGGYGHAHYILSIILLWGSEDIFKLFSFFFVGVWFYTRLSDQPSGLTKSS